MEIANWRPESVSNDQLNSELVGREATPELHTQIKDNLAPDFGIRVLYRLQSEVPPVMHGAIHAAQGVILVLEGGVVVDAYWIGSAAG